MNCVRYPAPFDWDEEMRVIEDEFLRLDDHLDDAAVSERLAQIDQSRDPQWVTVLHAVVSFGGGVFLGIMLGALSVAAYLRY